MCEGEGMKMYKIYALVAFHRWFDKQNDLAQFLLVIALAGLTAFGNLGGLLFGLIGLSRVLYVQKMQENKRLWRRVLDAI